MTRSDQRTEGLSHGFAVALRARRNAKPRPPHADAQKACADAVRQALEAAVVEALFSDRPEEFLDGLLLAQKTLTSDAQHRRGGRR